MAVLSALPSVYQKLLPSVIQWGWIEPPFTRDGNSRYRWYIDSRSGEPATCACAGAGVSAA